MLLMQICMSRKLPRMADNKVTSLLCIVSKRCQSVLPVGRMKVVILICIMIKMHVPLFLIFLN